MMIEKKFEKGDTAMLPVMVDEETEHGSPYDYIVSYEDTIAGGRNPLFVKSTDIVEASNIDYESKYHEAEAEIERLRRGLENAHLFAIEQEKALADYRYLFDHKPEWREYILHEMCEQWRALEE